MSSSNLAQIAADLTYAGGEGGQRLARTVEASATAALEVGTQVRLPGPGLTQLTGRRPSGRDVEAASAASLPATLDHANVQLVDGGVALALGRRA